MVRHDIIDVDELGEFAESSEMLDVAFRRGPFFVGMLQVLGALVAAGGVAMMSLPWGIVVLGCLMMIFGIAIEKDQRGKGAR